MEPQELQKFNWKRFAIMTGLVIFSAAAVGGSTYYVMGVQQKAEKEQYEKQIQELEEQKEQKAKEEKKTEQPTATVKDETADWKTYTNSRYGFSYKYPSNWSFDENATEQFVSAKATGEGYTFDFSVAGGRGLEGIRKFIVYTPTITNGKVIVVKKSENESESLPMAEGESFPTSGYAISAALKLKGVDSSLLLTGSDHSKSAAAEEMFKKIVSTITIK